MAFPRPAYPRRWRERWIPELALYKASSQDSIAKFALLSYTTGSRTNVYSSGPSLGKAYNHYYKILLFHWTRTDLPEKKSKK